MKLKSISLIRLFKMANDYIINLQSREGAEKVKEKIEIIADYLKYVNVHKNDDLN